MRSQEIEKLQAEIDRRKRVLKTRMWIMSAFGVVVYSAFLVAIVYLSIR